MEKILGLTANANKMKELIGDKTHVYFKSGVWNNYSLKPVEYALDYVKGASYGGDLYKDEKGNFYICCPSYCDMF